MDYEKMLRIGANVARAVLRARQLHEVHYSPARLAFLWNGLILIGLVPYQ